MPSGTSLKSLFSFAGLITVGHKTGLPFVGSPVFIWLRREAYESVAKFLDNLWTTLREEALCHIW